MGVVIRDHDGNFIVGRSKKFWCPLRDIKVEAKTIEFGLEFAKDMGIQDFVLEGDSLNIVHALSGNSHAAFVTPHNFITDFFLIPKLKMRPTVKWI